MSETPANYTINNPLLSIPRDSLGEWAAEVVDDQYCFQVPPDVAAQWVESLSQREDKDHPDVARVIANFQWYVDTPESEVAALAKKAFNQSVK
jgi:hypothetical protein